MRDLIFHKSLEIGRVVLSQYYPAELEIMDVVWESLKEILAEWIQIDPSQWPLKEWNIKPVPGLGLVGPEVMRLASRHIMVLIPAVLARLLTSGISNEDEVRKNLSDNLKTYGQVFSVPTHLVRYLEKVLPDLLIQIPESLSDTAICWKVLPRGIKKPITIKEARILPLKASTYLVLVNLLQQRHPTLYLDGNKLNARRKAVEILVSLLKKDGKVCTYAEIIEYAWGKLLEKLPTSVGDKYVERIERTINQGLKKASPWLKENIVNDLQGYKVEGALLNYCIIEN